MFLTTVTKRPNDHLDYDFDFARWMVANDRIVNATGEIRDLDAIVTNVIFDETVARIWVEGGTAGKSGTLTVLITTDQGRKKEIVAQLRICEVF